MHIDTLAKMGELDFSNMIDVQLYCDEHWLEDKDDNGNPGDTNGLAQGEKRYWDTINMT